jgi:3-oxoadipate enol-lactonase
MPYADVNGIKLYYEIFGEGEPIVFIHGVAITSRVWEFQKEFVSQTHQMIVYDLRGSGKSEKTPQLRHTAELLAEDLRGLLDYLGIEKTHIVGLSMGAAVAMKFAISYSQRVDRLVLSGAFEDLGGILNFIRKYFGYVVGKLLMFRFFGELATRIMLPSAAWEDLLYYHRSIIRIDWDEVRKYNQILASYSITGALGKIMAPTLILYGQYEAVLHKYGYRICENIANARMRIIPGVGHGWNGEQPELFSRMVTSFVKGIEIEES